MCSDEIGPSVLPNYFGLSVVVILIVNVSIYFGFFFKCIFVKFI